MITKLPFLSPGNIWSGSKTLAVFTNPTELAFRKGNLKYHYPIEWNGKVYPDVEAAYQKNKNLFDIGSKDRGDFVAELITIKFETYPILYETIKQNGGLRWLQSCSHWTSSKTKWWEGDGLKSLFIRCLILAYLEIKDREECID
jgi:hypothetical protein